MATDRGISFSKVSPRYLHSNSTSHTWAFSAFAELIDNAYDPDVSARELRIDVEEINGQTCLTFVDNGDGLGPDKLLKMLSFGFCEKGTFDNQKGIRAPIGFYGNGFKSGSMRLGKDAMVLTRQKSLNSMSVGLLSQTYLEAIGADAVLVPMVTWNIQERQTEGDAEGVQNNLGDILCHSVFRTEEELLRELDKLQELDQSTKIIIYNLHILQNGVTELDLVSSPLDIRCSESQEFDSTMSDRSITTAPEYRKSLRRYCSILFLTPKMKIYIRGRKVRTRLLRKSLSRTERDVYKPSWLDKRVIITFGFPRPHGHEEEYGIMMYHRNRLIKAYEKVGCQRLSNSQGKGVVGIVEADFLRPIHNKQDFKKDEKYNSLIQALGNKLKDYWNQKMHGDRDDDASSSEDPWTWAHCERCLKWRRLPDGVSEEDLPERWFCHMNPDATHNRCDAEEEAQSGDESLGRATYEKTYKRAQERKKALEKTRKERELEQKKNELRERERRVRRRERRHKERVERFRRHPEEMEQQQEQQQQLQQQQQQERLERQQRRQQQQEPHHLNQGGNTPPSTSGESPRKKFRLTDENGETIVASSQPSSQPATVDTIGGNTTDDDEENLDSEDMDCTLTDKNTTVEVDQSSPAQNDVVLLDSPYNCSNDGCSSSSSNSSRRRSRETRNDSNDSTLMEEPAAEIEELRIKLRNSEKALAEARRQAENTEKELAEARRQADDTEKALAEARRQAETAQVNLMTLKGRAHRLLGIIFPEGSGIDVGSPEEVDATIANIIRMDEERNSSQ